MGKIAFVFPGQGTQRVGMGKNFYDAFPAVKKVFDRAGGKEDIRLRRQCDRCGCGEALF